MKIIVCIDDNNGMMFNKRRQSKDSVLRQHILAETNGSTLWLNSYSASQFEESENNSLVTIRDSTAIGKNSLIIDENFLEKAGETDFAFVENLSLKEYENKISQIIIYKWNRKYPADFRFDIDVTNDSWKLSTTENFAGSSHDNITKEVYINISGGTYE